MLDGEGVAVRTARALLAACDGVIAVVRPDQVTLHAALTDIGCQVVEIPAGVLATVHEGMGSSIAAAARAALALPYLEQVLVQPADMPWVLPATIRQLIHEDNGGCPIVVPTFDGEDGHPVRFDRCLLPDLAALSGDRGARGLLLANPTHRMAVTDAGVRRDVDQPADLGGTPAA
jgi:molybdenum cofactor cytidylyltransferase